MKKRDIKEIFSKTKEELSKILKEYKNELEKITVQQKAGKLKNVMLVHQKRKDIARILGSLRNKEISKV
ncbi:50S ribosomal protein L29 [Candidatus Gottesmanbacteria bacterium]|nr:50S ribosomal protein L29 [Candidatus Gottesmanbacteria bacterium]MBI5452253.1 50S ribosomal protein L29 [Candidatus Gottesmanbacteria bacterium]